MHAGMGEESANTTLTYSRLLGARLYMHTWIRLGAVFAIALGTFVATQVIHIDNLRIIELLTIALVVASYNAIAYYLSRQYRTPELSVLWHRRLVLVMYSAMVLDFLALTAAVWCVGGVRSPFLVFYVLHVSLSCVILSRWSAITLTVLAYVLLVALAVSEWTGLLPPPTPAGAVAGTAPIDGRFAITVLTVYGTLFGTIVLLLLTLSERLREGERRIREANVELATLSDMRRDFLHIALHNLQSPIGAVTMHLNNLDAGLGGELNAQQGNWVSRCLKLLQGLNEFLQNFRMLNSLESGKIDAEATEVDMGALLRQLVDEHEEMAEARNHELVLELADPIPSVHGIDRLLREAIVNYIENAIKYTPDGGRIIVRAHPRGQTLRIEVEDNGIGIAKEDQEKLFAEFTRLNRVGTPVAQVKGSGLGLSIVRRVIEHHDGQTYVESEPGAGSTFVIDLPLSPASGRSAPRSRDPKLTSVSNGAR